jgi:uncharacterized membrane protein YdjX (TVP38/TMEM64 family)
MGLRRLLLLAVLIAAIAVGALWLPLRDWLAFGSVWVELHPTLAWPAFIGVYVMATVLAMPASILTLASGFVFGLPLGVALTSAGSTLGACGAFAVGRYLARDWIAHRIASDQRFEALDLATRHEGFTIVFLTRLSPLFPFNLLNYGLALTSVRFRDYAFATWIGMLPATTLYVYIGAAASDLRALFAGDVETGVAGRVLLFGGLAATVALTVLITRKARQALDRHLRAEIALSEDGQ